MPNFKISQLTTATAVSATNQFEINQNGTSKSLEVSVLSSYVRTTDTAIPITVSVNTASNALRITQTGAGNALVVEDSANPDATPFVIDNGGNVGIGTSSPGAKLDVVSDRSVIGFSQAWAVYNGASFENSITLAYTGSVTNFGNFQSNPLAFLTNNTERMRIDSSGNVGIGTSSPGTRLTVYSTTSDYQIEVGFSSTFAWKMGRVAATGSLAFTGYNGAATPVVPLTMDLSGNVGIGTSSPGLYAKLTVLGGSIYTDAALYSNDGTTTARVISSGGISYWGTTTNHPMVIQTNNTERLRIDSSGNVGIGTSSPVNRLQVNGSFGRGAPVTKTGSFTLADTENWLICNGSGSITVTLPAASSWTGREVMIKTIAAQTVVSASSNVVPVAGNVAATAILAATAGKWATLVSDGTNWIIMAAN